MDKVIKGSCLCESIRFEVRLPVLFFVHCHCDYCRKAQGAAFVSWVGFEEENFRYVSGGDLIHWFNATPESRRGFCPQCGSTMFYRSSMIPGEIHIARPYLEDNLEVPPNAHVFYDHKADWVVINDDLDKIKSDHEALIRYKKISTLKKHPD